MRQRAFARWADQQAAAEHPDKYAALRRAASAEQERLAARRPEPVTYHPTPSRRGPSLGR